MVPTPPHPTPPTQPAGASLPPMPPLLGVCPSGCLLIPGGLNLSPAWGSPQNMTGQGWPITHFESHLFHRLLPFREPEDWMTVSTSAQICRYLLIPAQDRVLSAHHPTARPKFVLRVQGQLIGGGERCVLADEALSQV